MAKTQAAPGLAEIIDAATSGHRLDAVAALKLEQAQTAELLSASEALTLRGHGRVVTYSRKVFIPLTQLCRDVCHYCTFAKAPRALRAPYMSLAEVLAIARAGAEAGCKEALFTLGDKPELRYPAARRALEAMGFASTLSYLEHAAAEVYRQTGLLPHLNPGLMDATDLARLRKVSVSMGIMLESASERLAARGGPHFGSPDKLPAARLATLAAAGAMAVPFTTGLLIGIGETRRERIEALLALRELHATHGHLQEVIIQNFRAKPGTRMAHSPEPALDEHLWSVAVTRLIFGAQMSIQAPPNLQPQALDALLRAGVNDWGGVSPVTPDHVNPEAPWPHLVRLAEETAAAGRTLIERLAITPAMARDPDRWLDAPLRTAVRHRVDALGRARTDPWFAGSGAPVPAAAAAMLKPRRTARGAVSGQLEATLAAARAGTDLPENEIAELFAVHGAELAAVLGAADALRAANCGDEVSYVVNRNINYTNICLYHCGFCAFSKGRSAQSLRGPAYDLDLSEIAQRTREAWSAGATEVCLQGGIHPRYTGQTYLDIVAAVKDAAPQIHVHAFSPLEITHGATTLGLTLERFLGELRDAGLSTLPGTAAEILDDEVRAIICPDKLTSAEWLAVMRAAHAVGLRSTATIMFGHVDSPVHWARHLLAVRTLQQQTAGFTEFVPLSFVHMEAPLWRKGLARSGPTLRESLLMHAVARLALHPHITNIQTSWVKMGAEGAALALRSGANDLGGTLMNESITRAAGGVHGQEFDARRIEALAAGIGRPAYQRTTLYRRIDTRAALHRPAVPLSAAKL
ncbi:MAG TPA: 5-amino-6-(D-ribitylamino)uracil--L-tyrosine 4-hydroxyphenyl transferase CofH [Steroidobacteraceae bacterium]